ncbi:MAG: hypothetical protein J07HQW2_03438 [Haloquadratum walsbyi J07HQW2]|uniref:Uncharacterized protein n=1 Tax=Haloquadratum walsbyi J07HQW2 TaxID=1238425 RepID=U1N271_9EURY|nr:MAG: hypothetical protein J07HQW2_03438 [Haloquadratum walsbyi J07HQW2]
MHHTELGSIQTITRPEISELISFPPVGEDSSQRNSSLHGSSVLTDADAVAWTVEGSHPLMTECAVQRMELCHRSLLTQTCRAGH